MSPVLSATSPFAYRTNPNLKNEEKFALEAFTHLLMQRTPELKQNLTAQSVISELSIQLAHLWKACFDIEFGGADKRDIVDQLTVDIALAAIDFVRLCGNEYQQFNEHDHQWAHAFVRSMERELLANERKGSLLSGWDAKIHHVVSEVAYHMAKLTKATIELTDEAYSTDIVFPNMVNEFAADIGNYMLKIGEMYGNAGGWIKQSLNIEQNGGPVVFFYVNGQAVIRMEREGADLQWCMRSVHKPHMVIDVHPYINDLTERFKSGFYLGRY